MFFYRKWYYFTEENAFWNVVGKIWPICLVLNVNVLTKSMTVGVTIFWVGPDTGWHIYTSDNTIIGYKFAWVDHQ